MTDHSLRLLLDFDACAQRDKGQTPAFLHRRDRKFALTCEQQGLAANPTTWLAHMNHLSGRGAGAPPSANTLRLWRRINHGFMAAGALLGVFTMLGLLFYDGGQRINVTVILAFVALQLLLALFTTAQSLAGWQPWRILMQRFTGHASSQSGSAIHTRLQPVLMARAAQAGGLIFALTGLATLLAMVVVQDLAFGWSTTLETAASSYHQLIALVAAPWAWLWPAAEPDLALVQATRFFRAGAAASGTSPARWGQWWPFVSMLWVTWVVLPRLVLFALAGVLVRRKARQLLASHPARRALMYRMETPTLDTGNEHNDAADLPDMETDLSLQPFPDSRIALCWAGANDPELPEALRAGKRLIAPVGGRMTLAQDRETLTRVAKQLETAQPSPQPVLLVTRGWEPPTGELEDFLAHARELWPTGARVSLIPLPARPDREPDTHQIQQWQRFARRIDSGFVTVSLMPSAATRSHSAGGMLQ